MTDRCDFSSFLLQSLLMTIEEFQKVDLRVGRVVSAERVEGSEKLLKLQIDIDPTTQKRSVETSPLSLDSSAEALAKTEDSSEMNKPRQILAGIAKTYAPEELVGKEILIIANLEPRMMMGMESQGMVLAAHGEHGEPILIMPEREVPPGSKIS